MQLIFPNLVHGGSILISPRHPAEVEDGIEAGPLPDQVALVDAVHAMGGHVLNVPKKVSRDNNAEVA